MSRRYPTAELYEERQRDFYRNGSRSERSYDELDIDIRNAGPDFSRRGRQPDFLRDDYGRTSAGPLVVRERAPSEDYGRPRREPERRPRDRDVRERDVEREEIIFRRGERDDRSRPREPENEETKVIIRRREEEDRPKPRAREVDREEITFRREEEERPRQRTREVDREEIIFRRGEGEKRPREPEREREEIRFRRGEVERPPRGPEIEKEEFVFRERERSRPPRGREVEKEEFIYRRDEREASRPRERSRETVVIRPRERSLPPPRLVAREREEFIVRRRDPSSSPSPERTKEEIIIRRTEPKSPSPPPTPPPPPQPEPIVRPPIIQEIITHHRHIDHGVERARSPSPPPRPPSPPKEESLEIAIRRQKDGKYFDENIIFEREVKERKERDRDMELSRRRSLSPPRRRSTLPDMESEAEYYNRKAMERAYIGEAYNGATKDWAIVDVPPGTNRVRMDGVGGGSQEITWQRYNGVRRAKFITEDEEFATDFDRPAPVKSRPSDMWTEITKDLVMKEAIDMMGYDYEETEYFFYVMEYLRYEDVLKLVELSDDIRRDRRQRIREIQYEREDIRERKPKYDERVYEREIIYDSRRDRYR